MLTQKSEPEPSSLKVAIPKSLIYKSSPQSALLILGNCLKTLFLMVFALVVICTMMAAFGASDLAWSILASILPILGRVGFTLLLVIASSIVFESFR